MKSKRGVIIVSIAVVAMLLCASAVIPTVQFSGIGSNDVNVSYLDARTNNETLTITANYSSGEFFEIGRDIIVATDSDFTNTLRMKSCDASSGNYVYEFNVDGVSLFDKVYVKPPILYMPVEISSVTVPLSIASGLETETEIISIDTELEISETDWFTVESVSVQGGTDGIYTVKVMIDAVSKDLPRFPKLCIGDSTIGGLSSLYFDENDNFDFGEFIFYINADSEAEAETTLAEASLVISDALIRVDADKMLFSSNTKSLSVVTEESE